MDEYIKRKDAFDILQSRLDSISQMSYLDMDWHELDIMRNAIENAIDDVGEVPSADVQPVKHGHWIIDYAEGSKIYHAHCSECGKELDRYIGGDYYIDKLSDYCPNCGSDMRMSGDNE